MMSELDFFKNFVEGRSSLEKVQLEIAINGAAEAFLRGCQWISPYTGPSVDGYEFISSLDESDFGQCWDAQDYLNQALQSVGINCIESDRYKRLEEVKFKAQPKWIDVDAALFVQLMDKAESAGYSGKDLIAFIKNEIPKIYTYSQKPPKWIQEPDWPIINGVPLQFIEQKIEKNAHDVSYRYSFLDKSTGEVVVVSQSA